MNRLLTPIIAAFFGALGGYFARQQPQIQANIQAQSFQLVDNQGVVRATFGMTRPGPALVMSDYQGRERIGIFAANQEASFVVLGESGQVAAQMGAQENGPEISLHYADGRIGPSMRVMADGSAHISIEEWRQRSKTAIGIKTDGKGYVAIEDPNSAQKRLELISGAGSNPAFTLAALQGKEVSIKFDNQGNPQLSLLNTGVQGPQEISLKTNIADYFGLFMRNGNKQNAGLSLQLDGDAKVSLKPLGGPEKKVAARGG